jgi:aldose 1-epimerase
MELTDHRRKVKLIYDAGMKFKFWMIWNNNSGGEFFCPEPQTCLVNAPNLPLSLDHTGVITLRSGEIWSETSRLYCIDSEP